MAQFGFMVGVGSVGQQNPLFGGNPAPYGVAQFGLPQGAGGCCGTSPFGQDSFGANNPQMTQMLQLMQVLMSILGGMSGMQGMQGMGMQGMPMMGGPGGCCDGGAQQMPNLFGAGPSAPAFGGNQPVFGGPQQAPPPPPPPPQHRPRPHHAPPHHPPPHHGPRHEGPAPQAPPPSRPHGARAQEGRAPEPTGQTGTKPATRPAQDPQNAQALQRVRDRIAAKGTDGSCVEYVEDKVGHYFPVTEARQMLDDGKHDGYDVVNQPQAGDIFVQTTGQYGHTGLVQSVNKDGTLTVADSNWNLDEKAHVHNIPANEIQGYLRQQQPGR